MLMTIEDLSTYLKISKETLYKMVQKGDVPGSKIGNQWRFQKVKIDSWLDDLSNTQETTNSNVKNQRDKETTV